jgi:carbamoylphosphate synthase small subunit
MIREAQISAVVSVETRDLLERYVRATGTKKGRLIESALRHHLQALEALPLDAVVQPRLVVTRRSGEEILSRIRSPRPTKALKKLMASGGD